MFLVINIKKMLRSCILLMVLIIATNAAKTTICERPPEGLQNVQVCCHAPMPNWGAYNKECNTVGPQPSCRLSCIFNSKQTLQDDRLNLTNVGPMLESVFTDQPQLVEAYQRAFVECAPLVRRRYNDLALLSKQSDVCDRHALFYSFCAYSRLIKHCPNQFWQGNNKQCRKFRNFVENCPVEALKSFIRQT